MAAEVVSAVPHSELVVLNIVQRRQLLILDGLVFRSTRVIVVLLVAVLAIVVHHMDSSFEKLTNTFESGEKRKNSSLYISVVVQHLNTVAAALVSLPLFLHKQLVNVE